MVNNRIGYLSFANFTCMKTTFTFLVLIAVSFTLSAQTHAPFSQKKSKITVQQSSLKNAQINHFPSMITSESWENESWMYPIDTHYEYDENGNTTKITTSITQTTKAYDSEDRLIETIMKNYDGGSQTYFNVSRTTTIYSDYDDQTENIQYIWDGNSWIIQSGWKSVFEYDAHGEELSSINSYYQQGVGWIESGGYKTEIIYNNDLVESETYYEREGGAWIPQSKNEWTYDNEGVLTGGFEYEYEETAFVLKARYTDVSWYLWDAAKGPDGSLPYHYTRQDYNGSGDINDAANYINSEKTVITYPEGNTNGVPLIMIETLYVWDTDWVESERYTEVNNSTMISEFEESWDGSSWIPLEFSENNYPAFATPGTTYQTYHVYVNGVLTEVHKGSSSYDSFGNIIEQKQESHNGDENWTQSQGSLYSITYDGSTSKMLQRIIQNWDITQSLYINYLRETYSYTPTNIKTKTNGVSSIYPTVFDSNIHIESSAASVVTFYNLTGVVVKQKQIFAGINTIQTSDLPKGYYILKIDEQTFKVVKR